MIRLSKSRIQSGRQCHKRLWLELHESDQSNWSPAAQARLDEGTRFGELARELLGGGMLVAADHLHVKEALSETAEHLSRPRSEVGMLFEPGFSHDDVRVRVDAFRRDADGDTLIEVKSTTSVKDEHLWDCAIQTWVARESGRPVVRVLHAHVDSEFVYQRENDYRGLLKVEEVTAEVNALVPEIPGIVESLKTVAAGPLPAILTGDHCGSPYECPFLDHCRAQEPPGPEFPISILPRAGKALLEQLRARGWMDVRDVPLTELRNDNHRRVAAATAKGVPDIAPKLFRTLAKIPYPRHYLDFETIGFVVPRWIGTRPFQQVPFQFSCHVERARGEFTHHAFLDLSGQSPLPSFVKALLQAAGKKGAVLVWNQSFEATRIRELAEMFPRHASALNNIIDRMVDLLPIYREHYYHPAMMGSWSIKAVLPTIAPDLDYSNLDVGDGGAAQEAYLRAISSSVSDVEREALRQALLTYCERDTWAMVRLAHWNGAAHET
ncbi:MAG: DUF2779 domain-containing protein [Xanthomonadales bacterium]|nr:DUF2779 domain-containing protein [Xanthomonadales bacterium]